MVIIPSLLQDYLEHSANMYPEKTALVFGENEITYSYLNEKSTMLAKNLCSLGIKRHDRVIIFSSNSLEVIISFWGVLKANAIVSIIDPNINDEKLLYILQDSGAKILITESNKIPQVEDLIIISCINEQLGNFNNNEQLIFHDVISDNKNIPSVKRLNLDIDLCSIIYTSGSTGEPKGVMLTHRNMLTASASISSYLEYSASDVIICVLPFSFDYGLYQIIMTILVGATLIVEKNFIWPPQILKKIQKFKVTVVPCVPTMVSIFQDYLGKVNCDLSSVRCVTSTGANLSEKNIQKIQSIFPKTKIYSMYGLTECKRCTYLPPKDINRKPKSIGIAIPNTELWIVDDQNNKVGPNVIGQLVIRGGTVMKGYWNKPEETEKKLKEGLLPGEKLLYTGDYCWLDEEGYLYFNSRMDEVIKIRGQKVIPKVVEDAIYTLADVKEVVVLSINNNLQDSSLYACVSLQEDSQLTEREILIHCKQKLENFHCPESIVFFASLPKSSNGKFDKREIIKKITLQLTSINKNYLVEA